MEVRGAPLHVFEWGEPAAPAVLYWDGLGGTGLHANELAPLLVREGFRVVAPDPPGHGRSPRRAPDSYRPSQLAALAAELLDALGVARAVFVGFSWGAEVALACAAAHPERTPAAALADGGYWDFRDLPGYDRAAVSLESCVRRARERARGDRHASWSEYFEEQRTELGRWSAALREAHAATMREEGGAVVPIVSPETVGAIHFGNHVEPTASLHPALGATGVPLLLLLPATGLGPTGSAGLERMRADLPRLEVRRLRGEVHDLVSHAPDAVAAAICGWLAPLLPHFSMGTSTRLPHSVHEPS